MTILVWTLIVTFLMVFLTQNTQNRDTEALQIKLDELIRVLKGAHKALLDGSSQAICPCSMAIFHYNLPDRNILLLESKSYIEALILLV